MPEQESKRGRQRGASGRAPQRQRGHRMVPISDLIAEELAYVPGEGGGAEGAGTALSFENLSREVGHYRARFGETPHTLVAPEHWPALVRAMRTAIARGRPLTDAETWKAIGVPPPPEGAELG